MSNIGSTFDSNIGSSIATGYALLAEYDLGDVIPHERIEEELDDPAWHAVRDYVVEVLGDGYRYIGELAHWVQQDKDGVRQRIESPYGYHYRDYWTDDGRYRGPDEYGIEPVMAPVR
jgi:hypothetical protein